MFRKTKVARLLLLTVLTTSVVTASEMKGGAISLVPDDAIIVLEVKNPRALIDRAFDEQVVSLVESLPPYQEAMAKPETASPLSTGVRGQK